MKKPSDTGISNFEQFVTSGKLYVDKTKYIASLLEDGADGYYLMLRPRGFGKSLMCSTLEYLFRGRRDHFEGLYVCEHTDYQFEKYPVLHFNFSILDTSSYDDFLRGFKTAVAGQAMTNGIELSTDKKPSCMLIDFLHKIDKPCAIIVDGYDVPVLSCICDKEKMEKVREAFSSFYTVIKNMGDRVKFLFITGATKLSFASIFSEANNLYDISMDARFSEAFGYTEEELETCFAEYIDVSLAGPACPYNSRTDFIAALRANYGGYRFSHRSRGCVFKPASIGHFFSGGCSFWNYWENRGVSRLAAELARVHGLLSIVDKNPAVGMSTFKTFDISEIADSGISRAKVLALLYYTGYLTIADGDPDGLILSFPNKEMVGAFAGYHQCKDKNEGSVDFTDIPELTDEALSSMKSVAPREFYTATPLK